MYLKRWTTGLIALPFLVFFIYRGEMWFFLLVAAAAELGLWEYFRIVLKQDENIFSALPLLGYLATGGLLWAAFKGAPDLMTAVLAFNLMAGGLLAVMRFGTLPETLKILARQIMGIAYVPLFLSFLVLTRNGSDGMGWIFFLLFIVFAGDTSALYVGSFYGRHKLSPAVSPGKTIEGSLGGLAANLIFGALSKMLFLPGLTWPQTLLCSLVIGAAGQAGDLFESMLKRASKVKDSGTLLPGHGGILDRIDALLFAAPVAYFLKVFIV
jgi:phosphatidate cytidylyltransferase